jgi:hypothetical protein
LRGRFFGETFRATGRFGMKILWRNPVLNPRDLRFFLYITSNGDAGKVTTAKNTVVYAMVGLVVIIVSQTVIAYIITKLD